MGNAGTKLHIDDCSKRQEEDAGKDLQEEGCRKRIAQNGMQQESSRKTTAGKNKKGGDFKNRMAAREQQKEKCSKGIKGRGMQESDGRPKAGNARLQDSDSENKSAGSGLQGRKTQTKSHNDDRSDRT